MVHPNRTLNSISIRHHQLLKHNSPPRRFLILGYPEYTAIVPKQWCIERYHFGQYLAFEVLRFGYGVLGTIEEGVLLLGMPMKVHVHVYL